MEKRPPCAIATHNTLDLLENITSDNDNSKEAFFVYVTPEAFVPKDQPLRPER